MPLHQCFSPYFANRAWEARNVELLATASSEELHLDLAIDGEAGQIVGYCVSGVSSDGKGCVELISVEVRCRGNGIGDSLMAKAIAQMKSKKASPTVNVAVGSEAVVSFFSRYGFYLRTILVQQAIRARFIRLIIAISQESVLDTLGASLQTFLREEFG